MMRFGIDIGSTTTKAVLLDGGAAQKIIRPTGCRPAATARQIWEECGSPPRAAATGYGRTLADFAGKKITEITCHARGVRHLHPDARALIDVGGQDSKAAALDANGGARQFAMNDKCAAGTGAFIESILRRFNWGWADLPRVAAAAPEPLTINATCAVFAESEVISLLANGAAVERILAGIHRAAAKRIARLFAQTGGGAPVYFTGGAAQNPLLKIALERELGLPLNVATDPQFVGAYGAAVSVT
ncbi:hypothetical protein FACS1894139_19300 [Planctomycetales bacterium]|nr:hypothetical protein FACS1894107_02310 [Planctomycetales bacterium]GHS99996.1 hypothetical protein FACS1894108_11100 [Planctomycetales bacterium]GHT09171.1 hypothetical protein FACS1894139_19300 [Planctomycetales bacterium]